MNIWTFSDKNPALQDLFVRKLGISPLTAGLLIGRGLDSVDKASSFINTSLKDFHDPDMMKDMKKGVSRIMTAIEKREKICIYGDYDVDGITATSLLVLFFREIGVKVDFYIPDRIKEGYGPNTEAIRKIHGSGCTLLITVDCGISAITEVREAKELGIDTIITDHHQVSRDLPGAFAILHPGQESCSYPFKSLAGVGITFKLIKSLRRELVLKGTRPEKLPNLRKHLDIVSLGTIADIAPLLGENHTIAKFGLREITRTKKEGLKALKAISGLTNKEIVVTDVSFTIGPRLNAIGRLGDAETGVRLLTTTDPDEAMEIAKELASENKKRQVIQSEIYSEARDMLKDFDLTSDKAIVLASPNWHPGVIGIVASKIAEKHYRPTVLICLNGETGKASARSVSTFHLYEGLKKCEHLLEGFGGHKYAAGLTIKKEMVTEFRAFFQKVVEENLTEQDTVRQLDIDSAINFSDLSLEVVNEFNRMGPFGCSNPSPIFCTKGVKFAGPPVFIGKQKEHVRVDMEDDDEVMEVIAFNSKKLFEELPECEQRFDIAFIPEINSWGNKARLQLRLVDLRPYASSEQTEIT